MSIVATLLDKARTRRGIPTDMALAERLGRSRAVVSEWRAGKSYPDEDLIVALAELAGDDPGEWLLAIKAIRTDGKAGKVWAALAKRLGAAAAVVLCAMGLAIGAAPETAQAKAFSTPLPSELPSNAAYVSRVWRYYASLLRMLLERLLQRDNPHTECGSVSACR